MQPQQMAKGIVTWKKEVTRRFRRDRSVSFYPAEDEEDEGEHEASVVAEGLIHSLLVGPSAVRSKHNHWALSREVRDREPR